MTIGRGQVLHGVYLDTGLVGDYFFPHFGSRSSKLELLKLFASCFEHKNPFLVNRSTIGGGKCSIMTHLARLARLTIFSGVLEPIPRMVTIMVLVWTLLVYFGQY